MGVIGPKSPCCNESTVERIYPSLLLGRQVYVCGCGSTYLGWVADSKTTQPPKADKEPKP